MTAKSTMDPSGHELGLASNSLEISTASPASRWVPPPDGQFADRPEMVLVRGVFGMLPKTVPALAASMAYRIVSRPPRSSRRDWQDAIARDGTATVSRMGNRNIHCHVWGQGETILLVHGWGSRGLAMRKFVQPLVGLGYRVVAFDAPGHGAYSSRHTDIVEFASAISRVAHEHGPVKAIVAHSIGGALSLFSMRDWGVKTEALVLISTMKHCLWCTQVFEKHLGVSPAVAEATRARMMQPYGGRFDSESLSVPTMLACSKVPALLIHDESDVEVLFTHCEEVSKFTGASLIATTGYGHHRILRSPEVVAKVSEYLVRQLQPAARMARSSVECSMPYATTSLKSQSANNWSTLILATMLSLSRVGNFAK